MKKLTDLVCLGVLAVLFCLSTGRVTGQADPFVEIVESVTLESGRFVIDSDAANPAAGYDRDKIRVEAKVRFTRKGSLLGLGADYRIVWKILDLDDNPVSLLQNGQSKPAHEGGEFTENHQTTVLRTYQASLDPAEKLRSDVVYRIVAEVQRKTLSQVFTNWTKDAEGLVLPDPFIHFTGNGANDPAVNAVLVPREVRWTKEHAVASEPDNDAFGAELVYDVYRYDNPSGPVGSDLVPVRVGYSLHEGSGGAVGEGGEGIPLAIAQAFGSVRVPSYSQNGAVKEPASRIGQVLDFPVKPSSQLNLLTNTHYVDVELSHRETGPGDLITDGAIGGFPAWLLHFNGTLQAGGAGVSLTLSDTGVPDQVFQSGDHFDLRMRIGDALLSESGYHFSSGERVDLQLLSNGDAVLSDGVLAYEASEGEIDLAVAGISFGLAAATIRRDSISGKLNVNLPRGLGYRSESEMHQKVYRNVLTTKEIALGSSFAPATGVHVFRLDDDDFVLVEDSKPLEMTAPSMRWTVASGEFNFDSSSVEFVRAGEMESLTALADLLDEKDLLVHSNDQYYQSVGGAASAMVDADESGNARISTVVNLGQGSLLSHFPYGAELNWTGGQVEIVEDKVNRESSELSGSKKITAAYLRECEGGSLVAIDSEPILMPVGDALRFTEDGGIGARCALGNDGDRAIKWQPIVGEDGKFVHQTSEFSEAGFYIAGRLLCSDSGRSDPTSLLLAGNDGATGQMIRPRQANYRAGVGDYPGANFRVAGEDIQAQSSFPGAEAEYVLTDRSKYNLRYAGVTGIHEAEQGSFPDSLTIQSFKCNFENFGLQFTYNDNTDSRTAGQADIPAPSNFDVPLNNLRFTCEGGLGQFALDKALDRDLEYWNAPMVIQRGSFHTNPDKREQAVLGLGLKAYASNVEDALFGSLGFHPTGQLTNPSDAYNAEITSRLKAPQFFTMPGPGDELWYFVPIHDPYFNNHALKAADDGSPGYLNFLGALDLPFFSDAAVHFHTGAQPENDTDLIHMTGGLVRRRRELCNSEQLGRRASWISRRHLSRRLSKPGE